MFATLKQVVGENWHWRRQVWNLAKIDLVKTYRGAALGKIWLFAKPAVYILVFWVALKFGLRSSSDVNGKAVPAVARRRCVPVVLHVRHDYYRQ